MSPTPDPHCPRCHGLGTVVTSTSQHPCACCPPAPGPALVLPGLAPLPAAVLAILSVLEVLGHGYVLTVFNQRRLAIGIPVRSLLGAELPRRVVADLMAEGFDWMPFPAGWVRIWDRSPSGGRRG